MLKHAAAASLALFATTAIPAGAAPYMIVGNDEKPGTDPQGKPIVNPTGSDTVVIFDLAKPEDPKVVVSLKLENSVVGPPTNLAISPNGSIALVADSMTVAEDNGARKMVPTDKLFVIDMKASPPKLAQTLTVGKQPSGLSFSPKGDMALVCNRADGTISVVKIDGTNVTQTDTLQIGPGVSHVVFTPDGKRALAVRSPDNPVPLQRGGIARRQAGDHRRQRQQRDVRWQPGRGHRDRPGGSASACDRARHSGGRARGIGDEPERRPRRGTERKWIQQQAGVVLPPDGGRHRAAHPGQDGDTDQDD